MSEPITPQVSARICKHMNQDHADAVLLYAQTYGQSPEATAATLKGVDLSGMDLDAQVAAATVELRIPFEPPLADAKEAHHRLVDMLKQVRQDVPQT